VAVDASGNIYVADRGNHRIQKFTSTGTFLSKWGTAGSGAGQFSAPFGVAVDASGDIYVADSNNDRIQKFRSSLVDVNHPMSAAAQIVVHPSVPNPTRETMLIRFDLLAASAATLKIYDVRGRQVRTAFQGAQMPLGAHQWQWDGRDDAGSRVKPGTYFYTLATPLFSRTRKAVIVE
jgi:hypothetical protein